MSKAYRIARYSDKKRDVRDFLDTLGFRIVSDDSSMPDPLHYLVVAPDHWVVVSRENGLVLEFRDPDGVLWLRTHPSSDLSHPWVKLCHPFIRHESAEEENADAV